MKLLSIASGSSGNSIFVSSDKSCVLVDAGISNKRIEAGLNSINMSGKDLNAIILTHEHSDHIKGLGVLARKYELPVYATKGTLESIKKDISLGDFPDYLLKTIYPDDLFSIGDLTVKPFHIHHDAADPVGFRINSGSKTVTVSTDLGHFDEYIIESIKDSDALLIEANHDVRMLETGPYPYYLKRRILSDFGHLSNENCGKLICRVANNKLKYIMLGHLSKENNLPELAFESVKCEIITGETDFKPEDFDIKVARRSEPSDLIEI